MYVWRHARTNARAPSRGAALTDELAVLHDSLRLRIIADLDLRAFNVLLEILVVFYLTSANKPESKLRTWVDWLIWFVAAQLGSAIKCRTDVGPATRRRTLYDWLTRRAALLFECHTFQHAINALQYSHANSSQRISCNSENGRKEQAKAAAEQNRTEPRPADPRYSTCYTYMRPHRLPVPRKAKPWAKFHNGYTDTQWSTHWDPGMHKHCLLVA